MEAVLIAVAALVCPVGMGLMMWFMARGMRPKIDQTVTPSLETLREEHRRLGDEIERLRENDRTARTRT